MSNSTTIREYEFTYNNERCKVDLNIVSEQIENENLDGKNFQTIIYEPFFTKSFWTKTGYKKQEERAFEILNSALNAKFNAVKLRDFNNRKRFEDFKEFTEIKDNEKAKKEYIYLNHCPDNYLIGTKVASAIWEELGCLDKTTKQNDIPLDFQFNLTWEYFVKLITDSLETPYAISFCEFPYNLGLGDTKPYVEEKLTIEPIVLFLANSLHTENKETTLILRYSLKESSGKLYKFLLLLVLLI